MPFEPSRTLELWSHDVGGAMERVARQISEDAEAETFVGPGPTGGRAFLPLRQTVVPVHFHGSHIHADPAAGRFAIQIEGRRAMFGRRHTPANKREAGGAQVRCLDGSCEASGKPAVKGGALRRGDFDRAGKYVASDRYCVERTSEAKFRAADGARGQRYARVTNTIVVAAVTQSVLSFLKPLPRAQAICWRVAGSRAQKRSHYLPNKRHVRLPGLQAVACDRHAY